MLMPKPRHRRWIFVTILAIVLLLCTGVFAAVKYYGKSTPTAPVKVADKSAKQIIKSPSPSLSPSPSPLPSHSQSPSTGCAISGAHGDPSKIDVVINKKHCFNPINFVPPDLTGYNGYLLSAKIVPDLTAMLSAAAVAGMPIDLYSSYRSYSNQVTTYNNWVKVNGSTAAADTVSARPGYSEHQTGFALDLTAGKCSLECFGGSAQYKWLQAHAATYGFIERYPQGLTSVTGYSPEAWHWRYVGPATAQEMKSKDIKTLEQLWNISGGNY